MSVHPNKAVCGGLLFAVLFVSFLFPPTSLMVPAQAQDVPVKEMEFLGTRLRHRTVNWQYDRGTDLTTYNIKVVNLSHDPIYPPIRIVVDSIDQQTVTLDTPDGTMEGNPYIQIDAADIAGGVLDPGEEHALALKFNNPDGVRFIYNIAYYGHMAQKEINFASVGVKPRMNVNTDVSVRIVSVRLDRARGGVEYRVVLKNVGDEDVYAPIRLVVDSITSTAVALADNYGEMDGHPYVVVEDEIAGGVLSPGEETDGIWLYFSDPPRVRFGFTTQRHGFKAYYYDVTAQLNTLLDDLGVQAGVNTFSVDVSNISMDALHGPVRMKITGMTVAGVPYTGDLASVVESKAGVLNGVPYQIIVPDANQLGANQAATVGLQVANTTGEELGFTFEFEAMYHPFDIPSGMSVDMGTPTNNAGAGTTSYTVTLSNSGPNGVISPMMLVLDSVDADSVELQNISGYIQGKPFIEVEIPAGIMYKNESQTVQVVFDNPQQISFTPVMAVQAAEFLADDVPPVSSYTYAYHDQWVNNNEVAVELNATDDTSGVKAIYYSINGGATQEYTSLLTFSTSDIPRTITFWAVDNANNVEDPAHQVVVKLDKEAPAATYTFPEEGTWLTGDATITFNADDLYGGNELSGVKNIHYQIGDGGTAQTVAGATAQAVVTAEGQTPVYFWAEDNAGNVAQQQTVMAWIDRTAPQTGYTYDQNGQWVSQGVSIPLSADDSNGSLAVSGVAQTYYTIDGVEYTGTLVEITEPGEYTVTCWSVDNAGNVESPAQQISVKIDTQAPSTGHDFASEGSWINQDTVITLTADDMFGGQPLSGVAQIFYKIGDTGTVESAAGSTAQVTVSEEGQYQVYFWAEDAAGNAEQQQSVTVWMDKSAPTTQASYANDGLWVTEAASISLTADDANGSLPVSGVAQTYYEINGTEYTGTLVEIDTPGEYYVNYWSVDAAGNVEPKMGNQIIVRIDRQAPVTTTDVDAINDVWVNNPVTVNLSATDNGQSGVAQTQYTINAGTPVSGTSINLTDDGIYQISYFSTDNLGNEEAPKSLTIKIDTQAPVTTDDYDGTTIGNVTINLTPTDENPGVDVSGVSATKYTLNNGNPVVGTSIFLVGTGTYTISYWSEDNAGNVEAAHTFTIVFSTAPQLFIDSPANGLVTTAGTVDIVGELENDSPTTITCAGITGTITGNQFQILGVPLEEGEVYYSVEAENQAGLKDTRYIQITKDTTPPSITVSSPADGTVVAATSIDIEGTVQEDTATYYIEKSTGTDQMITINQDGTFLIDNYPLADGVNVISLYGVDTLGNSGKTAGTQTVISVTSDMNGPEITLQVALYDPQTGQPRAPQDVTGSDVTFYNQVGKIDVIGQVDDPQATVRVNSVSVPVQADGSFTLSAVTISLEEGQEGVYTISARDVVQNLTTVTVRVIKDTIGPELFVTSFDDGDITNDPSPKTISGVARGTTQVVVNGQAVAVSNERFELQGWAVSEGTNTATVSGSDSIGNTTTVSLDLILDTTPAAAPAIVTPSIQPLYSNADRVTIHGTAELGSVVAISGGAIDVETNTDTNGDFTKNVFLVSNTTNDLQVTQRDPAGNVSAASVVTVIHDNRKPVMQISSPTYNITDSFQVLVSATVSDDVLLKDTLTIELDNGAAIIQTLNPVITSGSVTTMVNLGEGNYGNYTIKVTVADKAGNTRTANLPMQYIEPTDDTDGPEIVITSPQNEAYINTSDVVVTGTCIDRSGVASLQISIDGGAYSDIPPADYDNEGTGSLNHTVSLGADGAHTISVKAVDKNIIDPNETIVTVTCTVDTLAPITAPTVSGITPGTEIDNDAYLTNAGTIRVIGSYEPGFTVQAQSSIETQSATVGATGIYQVDLKITTSTQSNLENTITLIGFDKAGNPSTQTDPNLKKVVTVTYDGIQPLVTSIEPIDATTQVALHTAITVAFSEPIQSESLSGNQGNRIYVTDSQATRYDGTLTLREGAQTLVVFSLPDGIDFPDSEQLTITVAQSIKDLAGNDLQTSYTSTFFTIDETPPAVPQITGITPGDIINQPSFIAHVTTEQNSDILVYYPDNDTPLTAPYHSAGTQIDIEIFVDENTTNDFVLRAVDASGNQSGPSSVITVLHDNIRPSIVAISPADTQPPIAYNTVFEVEFDEEIAPDTIENGISLVNTDGPVSATYDLLDNASGVVNARVRIAPDALLSDGHVITLTVSEEITDIAGNSPDFSGEPDGVKTMVYTVEDNVAPAVPVIDTVSEESPTMATSVDVTGTTEPGAKIVINGGALTSAMIVDSDNDTGEFQATVPLQSNKNNVIAFKARDKADNTSESTSISLFSDTMAPTLSSVMPAEGAIIPTSGLFTLIFSEALDQATLDSIKIMKGGSEVPAERDINQNGNIITINSNDDLDPTVPHTLVVATGLTDEAGNAFAAERVINYLTNDPVTPDKPIIQTVSETSPTTANSVTITGFGENYIQTTIIEALKVGNTVVAQASVDDTSSFSITVPLDVNAFNRIRLRAKRPSGNIGEVEIVNIVQDISGPVINILAPTSAITLPSDSVTLVAHIEDASAISSCLVNGEEKVLNIDSDGYLNTVLENITDGMTVTIEAKDVVNNAGSASVTLTVNVEDPATETNPPVISIIYPEDGIHYDGKSISVMGTVEDANDISMITVNDEIVSTPGAFPTSAAYFYASTDLVDGLNVLSVNAWDINNHMSTASVTIDVDIAPPSIVISNPEYEAIFIESNVTVSGRVTDSNGVAGLTLDDVPVTYDCDGYFSVNLDLEVGENTLVFKATDIADNVTTKEWILYYDVIGPVVEMITPVDGETKATVDALVTITFDERIDPETVTYNTFKVVYLDDIGDEVKEVTGNITVDGKKAYFDANEYFDTGRSYRVKVLSGITDLVGFPLQSPTHSVFTTDTLITTLSGMVVDPETGIGIEGAKVTIVGTDIEAITDNMGNFTIRRNTIPGGDQIIHVDGSDAISGQLEGIIYTENRLKEFIIPNQLNSIGQSIFLPRLKKESTVYVNGLTEQVVTFNDTITGEFEGEQQPGLFSLTVPAGALEFPNGATSGALSAQLVHENYLPVPQVDTAISGSVVSAVWFHPYGVKCNELVKVNLPMPTGRGETGANPGDRYMMYSYDSETCEWVEIGVGVVNEDTTVLELENEGGLYELTVVAFLPFAITGQLESELRAMHKKYFGGSGEGDFWFGLGFGFFLIEYMVALSIMVMMTPLSLCIWQVKDHQYVDNPKEWPGVMTKISSETGLKKTNAFGKAYSTQRYYLWPSLIVLMIWMTLKYPVVANIDIEYTTPGRANFNGIFKIPIMGYTLEHSVFNKYWHPMPIYVDSWAYSGNIRFLGNNGLPTNTPDSSVSSTPFIGVYTDVGGSNARRGTSGFDGSPVDTTRRTDSPTQENAAEWWKSYHDVILGSSNWHNFRGREIFDENNASLGFRWHSFIKPGGDVRIVCKVDDYVGENYTKAPIPQINETTSNIGNINFYCNVTVGKINVDCYITRRYLTADNKVAEQILPYKGLASTSDNRLFLYTGMALANGKSAPTGDYNLQGTLAGPNGGNFPVKPGGDTPWNGEAAAGTYVVTIKTNAGEAMYINLSAKEPPASDPPPPTTRPQSGRGGGRGNYTVPTSTTGTASRRVTPVPPQDADRQEYTIAVIAPIMYGSGGSSHGDMKVDYIDFSPFNETGDPNTLVNLPVTTEDLFSSSSLTEPKITIDRFDKVALKVAITLNGGSVPSGAGVVFKITQVGVPFVLKEKLGQDLTPLSAGDQWAVNSTTAPTLHHPTSSYVPARHMYPPTYIIDLQASLGATINLDLLPAPNANTIADLANVTKYFDFLESEMEGGLTQRYWLLEIIDRNTLINQETAQDVNPNDSVYNLLERLVIYVD